MRTLTTTDSIRLMKKANALAAQGKSVQAPQK